MSAVLLLPNIDGYRLLRVWRDDVDGAWIPEVLPILCFAIDTERRPTPIVASGPEPLVDTVATNSSAGVALVTALLFADGSVLDAFDHILPTVERFVAALEQRDARLSARAPTPRREHVKSISRV